LVLDPRLPSVLLRESDESDEWINFSDCFFADSADCPALRLGECKTVLPSLL